MAYRGDWANSVSTSRTIRQRQKKKSKRRYTEDKKGPKYVISAQQNPSFQFIV